MPKNKRGSALLLTTILLFVVLSLVVSLSYVTVMEQQMSSKTKSSVGSFFNADSGVEWALNKIANATGGTIAGVFGAINFNPDGSTYPFANAGYKVYLLDSEGKVITDLSKDISLVKAVRSVGTQTAGDPTQRAIEAAVGTGEVCSGSPTEISAISSDTKNFAEAAKYCHVTMGGCWHVPSAEELGIFVNPSNEDKWVWTSTINIEPYLFRVRMPSGQMERTEFSRSDSTFVACVK